MKAKRYIFAAALTVIAAASCQDSIAPEQQKITTFNASFDPETKISLGDKDANGKVQALWNDSEKISVFDDNEANIEFSGNASNSKNILFSSNKGDFTDGESYYAVYPYHSSHSVNDGLITYCYGNVNQIPDKNNLPCEMQEHTERKLTVACAYGTKDNLSFQHIYALVKFTITREDVYSVTLVNKDSDKIATDKNFKISYNEGKFTPSFIDKGTIYYYKDKSKSSYFEPGTYYIAVRPCNLKVKIKLNNDPYKEGSTTHTLTPGMILDIGTLE